MEKEKTIAPGAVFGRWTALDDVQTVRRKDGKTERKRLCRCECGTERYVLERVLKSGGSLSCGCLRRERAAQAVAHDLTGRTFGDLTVIGKSAKGSTNRGVWWTCRCRCGKTCDVLGTLLVTGRKTHCGCKTVRTQPISDITGQVFGRLTALYPTAERSAKGSVLWHCVCACGRELEVSYNDLLYTAVQSCGCQKKEHDRALKGFLNHIDGTSLEMLGSAKLPANNTTGCRGVYFIKGKYVAKIVFQKKAYYLGTYVNMEDAVQARKDAEEAVFQTALPFYAAWKRKAEGDPDWAAENPVSVKVLRNQENRLYLEMLPSNVG